MSRKQDRIVPVPTGRPYEIVIGRGLIDRAGQLAALALRARRCLIVVDDTVDALYGERAQASFEAAGFACRRHVFPHGEANKTIATFAGILEAMADFGMARGDLAVALGGGVVGDAAGFAAACYGRGAPVMQIPTTLLAAVDSSVGGKTAVNLRAAKNMAGAFWQPSLVVCDVDVLAALPADLTREGAAEVIKYGALADAALLAAAGRPGWLDDLAGVVEQCVSIKRDIVLGDERDEGARQLLNLGHTVGHAI
ncbi:MAG: 3-dehydroquinate synthase, partial [Clostridiales bacterium]|nr:3-dehydroquinate synthase [Clostridiales bacterium]